MSSALDALPLVVPFFGVLLSSFTLITCCMNRRIQHLSNRVEQLELNRNSPQIVIQSTEPARPPPPPTIVQPPVYPVQQPYPYYQPYTRPPQPIPSAPPYQSYDPQNSI